MKFRARGRVHRRGQMNKLELAYSQRLENLKATGHILWWRYEAIRLRLADGAFFGPDFFVMDKDGNLEVHETKGYMQEAANVRLKVAAEVFPFKFLLVKLIRGQWDIKEV